MVPFLLLVVALAQAADAVTFAVGVPVVGIHAELNPLARAAFATGGMTLALMLKAALGVTLCSIIAIYRVPGWRRHSLAIIASGLGIAGAAGNLLATIQR